MESKKKTIHTKNVRNESVTSHCSLLNLGLIKMDRGHNHESFHFISFTKKFHSKPNENIKEANILLTGHCN